MIPNDASDPITIAARNELNEAEKAAVVVLWNSEYPAQLQYPSVDEFDNYLNTLSNTTHWLLIAQNGTILGWAIDFDREAERFFAIIISVQLQGQGFGSRLLNILKKSNKELSGWVTDHDLYFKTNGSPYPSPLRFYQKHGFIIPDHDRLELPHLSAIRILWKA